MHTEVFQETAPRGGFLRRMADLVAGKKVHQHDIGWRWVLFGSDELAFLLPRGLTLYTTSARNPRTETKDQLYKAIRNSRGMSFKGQGVNVYMPNRPDGDVNTTIEVPDAVLPKLLNIWLQSHRDRIVLRSADADGNLSLWEQGRERSVKKVSLDASSRSVRFLPAFAMAEESHRNSRSDMPAPASASSRDGVESIMF